MLIIQHFYSNILTNFLMKKRMRNKITANADGGPRSRVRARETLRSAPHRRERKFSGVRACRIAFKHLPQPLRSHIRSFRTPQQVFLGYILNKPIFRPK